MEKYLADVLDFIATTSALERAFSQQIVAVMGGKGSPFFLFPFLPLRRETVKENAQLPATLYLFPVSL